MARTYKRDSNGRFASGGGTRSGRPAAKPVSRGRNRLTRDNAGKITSVGGEGATARGGRLRTAGGKLRATQTAKIKSSAARANTIAKGGRGVRGSVARSMAAVRTARAAKAKPVPSPKALASNQSNAGQQAAVKKWARTNAVMQKAMRLVDNSHQDNALTRSLGKGKGSRYDKIDRMNSRISKRNKQLRESGVNYYGRSRALYR